MQVDPAGLRVAPTERRRFQIVGRLSRAGHAGSRARVKRTSWCVIDKAGFCKPGGIAKRAKGDEGGTMVKGTFVPSEATR